jgi:uncharacterized membrane protein
MAEDEVLQAIQQALAEVLRKQRELEQRISRLEGSAMSPVPRMPETQRPAMPEAPVPRVPGAPRPAMEARVGLTLVNRVGVVTLVLGVAFFFKWAVDNDWIGPGARVGLGVIGGLCALGIGDYLWRKAQQVFAQGITGTGLAILYLALYAGYGFYHLIPQPVAFLLLTGVTALAFALAMRYDAEAVGALGLFGGYLTPLLLNRGTDHPWFLLSYVLLLDCAALALVRKHTWRALDLLAVIASGVIYLAWWLTTGEHNDGTTPAAVFLLAYLGLFLSAGWREVPSIAIIAAALEVLVIWHAHVTFALAVEVLIAAAALYHFSRSHLASEYLGAQLALLIGMILEVLDWASRSSSPLNRLSVETVSVSVLSAVYALVLIGIGVARRAAIDRMTGLTLIAFVIAKLYIFDVWQLGRVYRIAAFVALGLLLITTSFLYSRFRNVVEALLKDE